MVYILFFTTFAQDASLHSFNVSFMITINNLYLIIKNLWHF